MSYSVNVALNAYSISRSGSAITLEIKNDHGKIGEIQIGRGSLRWKRANAQQFKSINWSKLFDTLDDA